MKRACALCAALVIALCAVSCGRVNGNVTNGYEILGYPFGVTGAEITHYYGADRIVVSFGDTGELTKLKNWFANLRCRPKTFEPGNAPGDADGGEAYVIVFKGEEDRSASYVKVGEKKCYLLLDDAWYAVENPSDPPGI